MAISSQSFWLLSLLMVVSLCTVNVYSVRNRQNVPSSSHAKFDYDYFYGVNKRIQYEKLVDPPEHAYHKKVANAAFRCPFINNFYELQENVSETPIWGSSSIKPIELDNREFKELLRDLDSIVTKLIQDTFLSNVENWVQMRKDFDLSGIPTFSEFFKSYRPTLHSYSDFATQSLLLLENIQDQIGEKFPCIPNSIYLSAALTSPRMNLKDKLKAENQDPPFTYFDYYVATIKIIVEEKPGYILMAPGHKDWDRPLVVVMESDVASNLDLKKFVPFPHNKNYIYVRDGVYDTHAKHLIHVAKPYCSFLDTTEKYNLLNPAIYLIKRSSNGKSMAGLFFYTKQNLFTENTKGDKRPSITYPPTIERRKPQSFSVEWPLVKIFVNTWTKQSYAICSLQSKNLKYVSSREFDEDFKSIMLNEQKLNAVLDEIAQAKHDENFFLGVNSIQYPGPIWNNLEN